MKNKYQHIIYFIIFTISFYSFIMSIYNYMNFNPSLTSFAPNDERLFGSIIYGTIPGLPLSLLFFSYVGKIIGSAPALWKIIVYDLLNLCLGFYIWIKLPKLLIGQIRKLFRYDKE